MGSTISSWFKYRLIISKGLNIPHIVMFFSQNKHPKGERSRRPQGERCYIISYLRGNGSQVRGSAIPSTWQRSLPPGIKGVTQSPASGWCIYPLICKGLHNHQHLAEVPTPWHVRGYTPPEPGSRPYPLACRCYTIPSIRLTSLPLGM